MHEAQTIRPETLCEDAGFRIQRRGRYLIAELLVPHRVISTSVVNGGITDGLSHLVNHQSCEATAHVERHDVVHAGGLRGYHLLACREAGLDPDRTALMGTAANMHYAGMVQRSSDGITVSAIVTAGVAGNAACAGDPATWGEGAEGFRRVQPYEGTINVLTLVDRALAPQTLVSAAMVVAEAKAAALQRLAVRSRYSLEFATGTTTDQFCVAARADAPSLSSASTGVRLGELLGRAIRDAALEALRWQNGLEPSYARSLFHALAGYGVREESFTSNVAAYLTEPKARLLEANVKAVVFEPMVAAAAFAIATLLDRARHGVLPRQAAREALRQQGASMAAGLAARPELWRSFHDQLDDVADVTAPAPLVWKSIALGWTAKWT